MRASMWYRYRSKAFRPGAVRRYSVLGILPSNDFVHVTYCASSSRRACTLRLPSVVRSTFFNSLKVNESLTARALTIPRRIRSWMMRSRYGSAFSTDDWSVLTGLAERFLPGTTSLFRAALALATVPPRNQESENDMQATEPGH